MSKQAELIPPQDLDAEEDVLGAMLMSPAAIETVRGEVAAEDFYRPSHGLIFETIIALHDAQEGTDSICVVAELERRGQLKKAGGKVRIHELAAIVPATANAPFHARIVREKARAREEFALAGEVEHAALNGGLEANPELAEPPGDS